MRGNIITNSKCDMNRNRHLVLFSIISVLLGAFSSLNAQQVVGTIVDSDGESIPYVTLTTLASLEKDAETIQIHYTAPLGYVAFDLSEKEAAIRATFQGTSTETTWIATQGALSTTRASFPIVCT